MWDNTSDGHLSPNTNRFVTSQLKTMRTDNCSSLSHLQRRLAQNREAARKSRMKKKAYVQELESGCQKLANLEQAIERARKQAAYMDLSNTLQGQLPGNVKYDSF
ncbi:hypothetical protein R6Q57_022414 [Mikania cordata]